MTSTEQTGSSLVMTAVLAAVPAIVAFGALKVIGGFDGHTSVLLGVMIWVAVAIFLVSALHRPDRSGMRFDQMPAPAHVPAPVPAPAPAPVTAAPAPLMSSVPAMKPAGLSAARNGRPDDLKDIVGVGPVLEKLLHSLGFFHFDQVANWTAAEIAWVDDNLEGFKGRVTRDNWVAQARELAAHKG